jgi:hypothetical protein
MRDLKSPVWIKLKAGLFLSVALMSCALLILDTHSWRVGLLLAIANLELLPSLLLCVLRDRALPGPELPVLRAGVRDAFFTLQPPIEFGKERYTEPRIDLG